MERFSLNRITPGRLIWLALAASGALTFFLVRHMTFYQDTWAFLIERRHLSAFTVFHPHNEHIVVLPVLIERLLLGVFGMTSALPEYVLFTFFLLAAAYLVFTYVRRRVGDWLALFAAILVLCLGPAWEVLLWPFEIGFAGSVVFGLAMLLALEREDRKGDIAACAFLILSFGFSSLGIPFAVGAVAAVLLGPRESWLRRAYVFAIPILLYAAWYLGWGHDAETHFSLRNVLASPRYVAEAVAVALGSVFGLGADPTTGSSDPVWGRALLIGLVGFFGYRQYKKPGFDRWLWPLAVIALTNWFLTAFNQFPGREPVASRYQYAGAIFILMLLANLLRDVRFGRRGILVAGAVTILAIGPNLVVLKNGKDLLQAQTTLTRADTAALDIAKRTVDPNFELTPEVAGTPSLINIYAGKYLEAVEEFGSPGYSESELLSSAPVEGRRQADIVLSQALPLSTDIRNGVFDAGGGSENCVAVTAGQPEEVRLDPGATRIEVPPGPDTSFSLRRFADKGEYPVATTGAAGESTTTLRIPRDEASQPWYLHVEAEQPVRVCR